MRRRRLWIAAIGICLALSVLFTGFWKRCFILPVLEMLNGIGSRIPFPVLEYMVPGIGIWILGGLLRSFRQFIMRILMTALAALLMFVLLWLPLFERETVLYLADTEQMHGCAEVLIGEINSTAPDFTTLPEDLPAKSVHFPFWMRKLGISGFYSFFTGEALVSPALPACALPFVAVHESMHGRGIADEGHCNIAAYAECMDRGGLYAESARLWALRYVMGQLRGMDYGAYAGCMEQMNAHTLNLFWQMGGAHESNPQKAIQSVFADLFPGSDYEILAHWLAVQMHE